ncbi:MAG: hypothetical protein ACHP9Y_02385, partial [Gammaproteobacteria bacterium]
VFSVLLGHRFRQKENGAHKKEIKAIEHCRNIVTDCQNQVKLFNKKSGPPASPLDRLRAQYIEKIKRSYSDEITRQEQIAKLEVLFGNFKLRQAAIVDKLPTIQNDLTQALSPPKPDDLPHGGPFSYLQRTSRDYRDSISAYEKPTSTLHQIKEAQASQESVGMTGFIVTIVMAVFTLGLSLFKKWKIDDPRANNIVGCDNLSNHLEKTLITYKSQKARLNAEQAQMELDFKKEASLLIPSSATTQVTTHYRDNCKPADQSGGASRQPLVPSSVAQPEYMLDGIPVNSFTPFPSIPRDIEEDEGLAPRSEGCSPDREPLLKPSQSASDLILGKDQVFGPGATSLIIAGRPRSQSLSGKTYSDEGYVSLAGSPTADEAAIKATNSALQAQTIASKASPATNSTAPPNTPLAKPAVAPSAMVSGLKSFDL